MPTLWDAFLEDYGDEIFNWSLRFMLQVFWHYCEDGLRSSNAFLENDRVQVMGIQERKISDDE